MRNEVQPTLADVIKRRPWIVRCWLILASCLLMANTVVAREQMGLATAPSNPAAAGFIVDITSPRLGGDGLQPLELNFRPIGKTFNRQRRLRLQFRPRGDYATKLDYQFSQNVVLPQDATSHRVTVLVPHFYRWQSCALAIYENGRRWGKRPTNLAMTSYTQDWGQRISIGIVRPRKGFQKGKPWTRMPDLRSLSTEFGDGPIIDNVKQRLSEQESLQFVDTLTRGFVRFRLLGEDELPATWMGHSQLDVIMVPRLVIERIEQEQTQQYAAIEDWITTGGELWIYDADPIISNNNAVENKVANDSKSTVSTLSLLAGPRINKQRELPTIGKLSTSLRLNQVNDTGPVEYQPWGMGSFYANSFNNSGTEVKRRTVYDRLVKAGHPSVQDIKRGTLMSQLEMIRHGVGRVVLIAGEDPFPGSFNLWRALRNDSQEWNIRRGVDYSSGNESYWAWLMSTVGQPPVTIFLVLNALFVVIMGPVLYFLLRRRGRLYLLYFLVPAMAAITTLGLFGFAFVSDGFVNRARIRQLTWIDGRRDLDGKSPVLNESRQTYYTVVDNRRGLTFDPDALVLPVLYREMLDITGYYTADSSRSGDHLVERTESGYRFYGDFLPVRTQKHYLVTQPDRQAFPIEYQFVDGTASVTHRFESVLEQLVIVDPDTGKPWTAKRVSPGQSVVMQPAAADTMNLMTQLLIQPDSLAMPAPYQRRFTFSDKTHLEGFFEDIVSKQPKGVFMATTTVAADQFALRDCQRDQCVRVIGGRLP